MGSMGANHARVLSSLNDVDLVVVADPALEPAELHYGAPAVNSVEKALGFNLDFAVVAVPTAGHEEVALACAGARVGALIEKPMAHSVDSARRIRDAFRESEAFAAVGQIERFNPAVSELKNRLDTGFLGPISQVSSSRQSSFPSRVKDVGVVRDLATHDLDLTQYIFSCEYEQISAFVAQRSGRDYEDLFVASGRLKNGVLVNHVVNWLSPLKERRTTVIGERGMLTADTALGDLTFHANGEASVDWGTRAELRGVSEGTSVTFSFDRVEPLKAELAEFAASVRGVPSARLATLDEGADLLELVQRIVPSQTG